MKLAVFNTRDYEQTLINTARGPIIDTQAVIKGLQSGKIAYLGLDVYEHERGLFFCDHSGEAIIDLSFNTLVGLDNVLLTGHQAFLTKEALHNIANTTLQNITDFENSVTCPNLITAED